MNPDLIDTNTDSWFPLYEFQDWVYRSFVVLPTAAELAATPGSAVTAQSWGRGDFLCGQAFNAQPGYLLGGRLVFRDGIELDVKVQGSKGRNGAPASFEGVGVGLQGPTKGAISKLVGWVFPRVIENGAAQVATVRGSVWTVRGPDARPELDLSGLPLGTVGSFVIERRS